MVLSTLCCYPLGERKTTENSISFLIFCSQVDISGGRKAIVINVPFRLRKAYRKIHVRLVRELEKKFSGKVFFLTFPCSYECSIKFLDLHLFD